MTNNNPPFAIHRSAEDPANLLARANTAFEAGERLTRQGLERYREAGLALQQARDQCDHGQWMKLLKQKWKFPQQRASECRLIATHWDKLPPGGNLTLKGALAHIREARGGAEDDPVPPEADAPEPEPVSQEPAEPEPATPATTSEPGARRRRPWEPPAPASEPATPAAEAEPGVSEQAKPDPIIPAIGPEPPPPAGRGPGRWSNESGFWIWTDDPTPPLQVLVNVQPAPPRPPCGGENAGQDGDGPRPAGQGGRPPAQSLWDQCEPLVDELEQYGQMHQATIPVFGIRKVASDLRRLLEGARNLAVLPPNPGARAADNALNMVEVCLRMLKQPPAERSEKGLAEYLREAGSELLPLLKPEERETWKRRLRNPRKG
jgi:hypothetical protein